MKEKTKYLLIFLVGGLALWLPFTAAAVTADFGVGYGTYIGLGTQDVRITISRIINIALGILGIVVTLLIMYGGFVWMTAYGNEDRVSTAKKIITTSVIGLLIVIVAYALSNWIFGVLVNSTQ